MGTAPKNILALDKEKCCGCESCLNICPTDAIKMQPDELGFLYPSIEQEKCNGCGACIHSCPQMANMCERAEIKLIYGGYARQPSLVEDSSSGGFFTLIADAFLDKYSDSSIAAAVWTDDYRNVRHILGNRADLNRMRRSKYIQSRKETIFREIKRKLLQGENVLFVGLPCETAGLTYFLQSKQYPNLFLVDLVCQGPTSQKVLKEYVDFLERKYHSGISDIHLRFNGGKRWIPQWIKVEFNNGKRFIRTFYETEFGYALHYMQRSACYDCQWNGKRRCSDITLGDFHGVSDTADYYNPHGTSIAVINTVKGKQLFASIPPDKIVCQEVTYDQVVASNPRIDHAWAPLPGAKKFMGNYRKYSLRTTVLKTLPLKKKIRFLLPNCISNFIDKYILRI